MTRASELRALSMDELLDQLDDAKEELFNLRFQQTSGQLEDTNRISITKFPVITYDTGIIS